MVDSQELVAAAFESSTFHTARCPSFQLMFENVAKAGFPLKAVHDFQPQGLPLLIEFPIFCV